MRWFGLYTQRAQGIPGGKTAVLEPEELEDSYFMMRVRIDGGQLSSDALRVIGGISTEFGRDVADVTDRQNVQYHWIRIEDVPEIWRRLEAVGLAIDRGLRRHPARHARLPAGRHPRGRGPRRHRRHRRDRRQVRRQPGVLEPAAQVEDLDLGLRRPLHRPRDQRRLLRRRPQRRRRGRLRPLGRRRPVDQPEVRPADRRLRPARPGHRRLGRLHRRSSATTATAGSATTRGSSS